MCVCVEMGDCEGEESGLQITNGVMNGQGVWTVLEVREDRRAVESLC